MSHSDYDDYIAHSPLGSRPKSVTEEPENGTKYTHCITIKRKYGEEMMFVNGLPDEFGVEPIMFVFHKTRFVPDTGQKFKESVTVVFGSGNKILRWGGVTNPKELEEYQWNIYKVFEGYARAVQ